MKSFITAFVACAALSSAMAEDVNPNDSKMKPGNEAAQYGLYPSHEMAMNEPPHYRYLRDEDAQVGPAKGKNQKEFFGLGLGFGFYRPFWGLGCGCGGWGCGRCGGWWW